MKKSLLKLSIFLGLMTLMTSCRFTFTGYNPNQPSSLKKNDIPFWEPISNPKVNDITVSPPEYYNTKYDTSVIFNCQRNLASFFDSTKKLLENKGFYISKITNEWEIKADKEEYIDLKKAKITIHIAFTPIIFKHSNYPGNIYISLSIISQDKISNEKIISFSQKLMSETCSYCITLGFAMFGFANDKERTPGTPSEEIIFLKFGLKGLKAIDAINGINTVAEIMKISGMNEDELNALLKYLIENNFVKIKGK